MDSHPRLPSLPQWIGPEGVELLREGWPIGVARLPECFETLTVRRHPPALSSSSEGDSARLFLLLHDIHAFSEVALDK